jgi:hypothetical protein
VMRGFFDVEVPVLTRSSFGANQSTAVNILEITIGELVASFGVFGLLVVDAQMSFADPRGRGTSVAKCRDTGRPWEVSGPTGSLA